MLLIGLILFCFLLILFWRGVVAIVGKIGKVKGQEQKYRKYTTYLGVFIAVVTILFLVADEKYTDKQFKQLCEKEAGLKVYKKVGNVDGFLYMSKSYAFSEPKYFKEFKFYENVDRNNGYKIKDYYTKKQNNKYIIDYFVVMTERKYIGKGKYKETLIKEDKIYFDNYKIDRYVFTNNDEYSMEENVQPISRYALLETSQSLSDKSDRFSVNKMVIFDTQDYSIMVEHIVIVNGGGRFSHFLGSFYGGSYVGDCGLEQGRYISPLSLIKRIF